MLRIVLFILLSSIVPLKIFSQGSKDLYSSAFNEQLKMLKGVTPVNFKRAVFLIENAFTNGNLNYVSFCNDISIVAKQLKEMIRLKGIQNYKTAGNWAVFTYMTDTLPMNNFKPFTYDFDDFMGANDWTKMFVTKLIKTHSGNCRSLPYYYKILCDEIGASAHLALAPNHVYIKHKDEKGQWANVELTNGGFPRDQWIIKEMAISVEAIRNNSYMAPLTPNQTIAMTMFDLTNAYQRQFGKDKFVLEVADMALKYFPNCIPLLQTKANYIDFVIKQERKKSSPDQLLIKKNIALYKSTINKIDQLGYKDMPPELYKEWVKAVEKEKSKRNITSPNNKNK